MKFKTTKEIKIPEKLIDQVIGQDKAVDIVKKAAVQKRNILLIGQPGTGKSMIGQALAQLLSKEKLVDILSVPNQKDEDKPLIKTVPAGQGQNILANAKLKGMAKNQDRSWLFIILLMVGLAVFSFVSDWFINSETSEILMAADRISSTIMTIAVIIIAFIFYFSYKLRVGRVKVIAPKVIVDNTNKETAPFIDATGLHDGALLGDVKHDPFQTGGLGTPAHERVVAGAIHKSNKGVLFIDEIGTLRPEMQIELLTSMQEKKYPITGRSERSAGAMVQTEPVPSDYVFVGAGNIEVMKHMHPALRSRLTGYGYEVYMNYDMEDNAKNREKIVKFVAQEVQKDKKIPHFTKSAIDEIIKEARKLSGRRGYLTLKLRDLGGIVRISGDLAKEDKAKNVLPKHVQNAKKMAVSLEQQMAQKYILEKKDYQVIKTKGSFVGRVNGLAVISNSDSGLILPIEATMAPSMKRGEGRLIATGKLGEIAKEAVENVSAIVKKFSGKDISNYDIHIQFLQTYEGVEGDSASISIATAILSALVDVPVKQNIAMSGSLTIRGEVLPVGGINAKIEAAKEAGLSAVIVPKMNEADVYVKGIKIIPAGDLAEVLANSLDFKKGDRKIISKIKKVIK